MKTKPKFSKEVKAVNAAIESLSRELYRCRKVCACNGSPLRRITYRVFADGHTDLHATYRRKKTNK